MLICFRILIVAFLLFPSLSLAQTYNQSDRRLPTLNSYIVELTHIGDLYVGNNVGDRDGVGQLGRIELELFSDGTSVFPAIVNRPSQHHKAKFRTPAIEVRSRGSSDFGGSSTVEIRNGNQISLGRPVDRPLPPLSILAEPHETIELIIRSKEFDGCVIANCNRGAGGRTKLSFILPEFMTELPGRCMPHNTFRLNRIDEDYFFGVIPTTQNILDDGIEISIIPERSNWSICIRKNLGGVRASFQLRHASSDKCLEMRPFGGDQRIRPAVLQNTCASTSALVQHQQFEIRPVAQSQFVQVISRLSASGTEPNCLAGIRSPANPQLYGTTLARSCEATADTQWKMVRRVTDGQYHLVHTQTQMCMALPDRNDQRAILDFTGTHVYPRLQRCDPDNPRLAWVAQTMLHSFQRTESNELDIVPIPYSGRWQY